MMDMERQKAIASMWELGDYPLLASRLQPAAEQLAHLIGGGDGRKALDVAAGTGAVAAALAQRGWRVTAADISPALIEKGKQETAGLDVQWQVAPLEKLPFAENRFDVVASSFGLIFTSEPQASLTEIGRCLHPDGRLAFTAWTPDGYMCEKTAVIAQYMPADLPKRPNPADWGDPAAAENYLNKAGFTVEHSQLYSLPWQFDTVEAGTQFLFNHSPGHIAATKLAAKRAPEMITAVQQHLSQVAGTDTGPVDIVADYTITIARRL